MNRLRVSLPGRANVHMLGHNHHGHRIYTVCSLLWGMGKSMIVRPLRSVVFGSGSMATWCNIQPNSVE